MSEVPLSSLVIDSRKLIRMAMDGPALKVVMNHRSPILFPLRRLSRIHIFGTPNSGMEALMICAERQIPVAFFNIHGKLKCRLIPAPGITSQIDHWFEHVDFDDQIRQLYSDWLLHQELHTLSKFGANTGAREYRRNIAYEALRGFCRQKLGRDSLKSALEWLDGFLHFHLEQVIESFGFVQQRGRSKLLKDLKPVFDLWLLYALANRLQKSKNIEITARSMTEFYQQQADGFELASRRMLIQLVNKLEAVI